MQLGETGGGVSRHQDFGVRHRLLCWQALPSVGPKVVATKHHPVEGQTTACGDAVHELSEVAGAQAGVTTRLVNLVGCRLDQDIRPCLAGLQDSGLENQRMGRADRGHADGLSLFVALDRVQERTAHSSRLLVGQGIVPAW